MNTCTGYNGRNGCPQRLKCKLYDVFMQKVINREDIEGIREVPAPFKNEKNKFDCKYFKELPQCTPK